MPIRLLRSTQQAAQARSRTCARTRTAQTASAVASRKNSSRRATGRLTAATLHSLGSSFTFCRLASRLAAPSPLRALLASSALISCSTRPQRCARAHAPLASTAPRPPPSSRSCAPSPPSALKGHRRRCRAQQALGQIAQDSRASASASPVLQARFAVPSPSAPCRARQAATLTKPAVRSADRATTARSRIRPARPRARYAQSATSAQRGRQQSSHAGVAPTATSKALRVRPNAIHVGKATIA